jgi:hypothetical protein
MSTIETRAAEHRLLRAAAVYREQARWELYAPLLRPHACLTLALARAAVEKSRVMRLRRQEKL